MCRVTQSRLRTVILLSLAQMRILKKTFIANLIKMQSLNADLRNAWHVISKELYIRAEKKKMKSEQVYFYLFKRREKKSLVLTSEIFF